MFLKTAHLSLSNRHKIILLGLFFLVISTQFIMVGWNRMLLASNSSDGDQNTYLQMALDLREQGTLSDGVRTPLYPALLAFFAKRDWAFFTWGKILSLSFGLLTVWATYKVGTEMFDRPTGMLAAFLLSINKEFILHSTVVLAEALLSLLVLLTWFVMIKALRHPQETKRWMLAGLLAGLTYLAKGTGLLFVLCFMLTATLLYSYRIWARRQFWAFIGSLILVSLPLWTFNWFVFGSPIYNMAINNVMWMDSAEEKYVLDQAELPTLQTFLQEKDLSEIWGRLWDGLLAMRFFFFKSLWPTRTVDQFLLAGGLDVVLAIGVVLSLIFGRRLWPAIKRNRAGLLLSATIFATFYVLFGWYFSAVDTAIRFIVPLSPFLLLLIAAALIHLFRLFYFHPTIPSWTKLGGYVVLLLLFLWGGRWFAINWLSNAGAIDRDLFVADAEFNSYYEQSLRWALIGHDDAEELVRILWGPSHNLPIWRQNDRFEPVSTPVDVESVARLQQFMTAEAITYIIVDEDMARRRRNLAREIGWVRRSGGRLEIDSFPADWALGLTIPDMPCRWCVFRHLAGSPTIEPADYLLADEAIRLFGYELETTEFYPDGQIVLTLYWEAFRPVALDYTVFTQLLGPDFQLHGQMDRQPLSGHWPTSQWRSSQKFFDKFVLEVGPTAPAGEYTLLVGLYDLKTGQRATATASGQPIPDQAIRLHRQAINPVYNE